jgi:hypothetical protein
MEDKKLRVSWSRSPFGLDLYMRIEQTGLYLILYLNIVLGVCGARSNI